MKAALLGAATVALLWACMAQAQPQPQPQAKELGAGALFVICSATPSANKMFDANCDAFLEGFVTGMKSAGVACPPPGAYRRLRKVFLGLPKAAIGDSLASEILAPLLLATYRCGEEKPEKS